MLLGMDIATDAGTTADIMVVIDTMMGMGIMEIPAGTEEINHVEIYQTVSVFCHSCGLIYDG